jgi:hypothetical protein
MGMTADEAGERMSQREFLERIILERIDPPDSWRQLSEVLAAIFNVHKAKETEMFHPSYILASLVPGYTPPEKPEQTEEEMLGVFTAMASM